MRKILLSSLAAGALLIGAAAPALAATGDSGSVSCEVFQKGAVRATGRVDLTGWAPGYKTFDFYWGTTVKRTYNAYGTASSGAWNVTSTYEVDAAATNGFCYGG